MVGDVLDLRGLVVVRQDDGVALGGQPADLVAPVLPLLRGPLRGGRGGERCGHRDLRRSGFQTARRKPLPRNLAWVP